MTRFLLGIGTYCISCVVQQTSGVKDLSSLVRYDGSSLGSKYHTLSTTTPKYTLTQRLVSIMEPAPLASSANQHCFTLDAACRLVIKGWKRQGKCRRQSKDDILRRAKKR